MKQGRVVKAISGFFDVYDEGVTRRCRARGVFKKQGVSVLVGDRVTYEPMGLQEGVVVAVEPRTSELIRPPIANVDHALVVFAFVTPDLSRYMLDKTLVATAIAGVEVTVVLSKADLVSEEEVRLVSSVYRSCGYKVIPVATKLGLNVADVLASLQGKINVFAGPSGAGKSTLANAVLPGMDLQMGDVSEKIGRGKQTTRHIELFRIGEDSTWLADAPGFSQLQLNISSRELTNFFPDFTEWMVDCAYRGCAHLDEEDCAVKQAVDRGDIAESRYESYQLMYKEVREREESMY